MLTDFDKPRGMIGLLLNLTKTMFIRDGLVSLAPLTLNGTNISECSSYVHLGRKINMMNDIAPELSRRKRAAWEAFKKHRGCSEENKEHPTPCPPFRFNGSSCRNVCVRNLVATVTCNRAGEKSQHNFSSMDAAKALGGQINNVFGWRADMKNFDMELLLNIRYDCMLVMVALNRESLFKRNTCAFGPTTMRPTMCYCMAALAQPNRGATVVIPVTFNMYLSGIRTN
uniref:THUMP domain-containing protein n=1 Tax=Angiostrongylus cantonensis TaxID=6313 RepID=A0A0K0DQC9_ANGCA